MIDTDVYGLHKPEDTDPADFRLFVGDNMDLIESALIALDNKIGTGTGGSVDWTEITNIPTSFPPSSHEHSIAEIEGLQTALDSKISTLPIATTSELGAIKVGAGLTIDGNGTLSAKVASASQAGIVQVGYGLGMSGDYLFVKTGTGLEVNTGTNEIKLTDAILDQIANASSPPVASTTTTGIVRVGDGLQINNEYLSVKTTGNLTIDENGFVNTINSPAFTNLNVTGSLTIGGSIGTEDRINASLKNSWLNFAGFVPTCYWKDKYGVVHIEGLVQSGTTTNGTVVFTLPAGYRPPANLVFATHTSPQNVCRVDVSISGDVIIYNANPTWLSFAGITFKAV